MPAEMLRFRGDGESHVTRHLRSKGLLAMFDSAASVHHRTPRARMTMDYIDKRAFAQGVSDSYTAARRQRGPSSQLRGSTAARVRGGIRRLRERWRCRGIVDPAGRQMLEVRLAASRSWYRGFAWHQALLREDASLLRWVLQESYIT
jgi:hypothetical protein